MKKRSYLLLELTIALSIVGFVSYFFIRHPYELMKSEWEFLGKVEKERTKDLDLWAIKALAYERASKWDGDKTPFKQQVNGRTYRLTCEKSKKDNADKNYYLIRVYEAGKILDYFYIEIEKEKVGSPSSQ